MIASRAVREHQSISRRTRGMMQHPMPGEPSTWLPYVQVDDIVAATEKAKSLGATIVRDVMDVMGAGKLSIFLDPTGATLGLWQPIAK